MAALFRLTYEAPDGGIVEVDGPACLAELAERIQALPFDVREGADFTAEQVGGGDAYLYTAEGGWEEL